MLRKIIKVLDSIVDKSVAFLCLLFFLVCLYATLDAVHVYAAARDTGILKYKPTLASQNGEVLRQLSEDAVAWLTIADTNIDQPIMQGKTNDTYLNKDPYGEFSLSGSIFLDARNAADFTDRYSLVYGHHMEHGAMFGALDAFKNESYFAQHRKGVLMAASGKNYNIWFFACCAAPADESVIFDPSSDKNNDNGVLLQYLEQNAFIYEPEGISPEYQILGLSTCQSAETIERLIVFGVLQEIPA